MPTAHNFFLGIFCSAYVDGGFGKTIPIREVLFWFLLREGEDTSHMGVISDVFTVFEVESGCRKDGREAARGGLYTRVETCALHMDSASIIFYSQSAFLNSETRTLHIAVSNSF